MRSLCPKAIEVWRLFRPTVPRSPCERPWSGYLAREAMTMFLGVLCFHSQTLADSNRSRNSISYPGISSPRHENPASGHIDQHPVINPRATNGASAPLTVAMPPARKPQPLPKLPVFDGANFTRPRVSNWGLRYVYYIVELNTTNDTMNAKRFPECQFIGERWILICS